MAVSADDLLRALGGSKIPGTSITGFQGPQRQAPPQKRQQQPQAPTQMPAGMSAKAAAMLAALPTVKQEEPEEKDEGMSWSGMGSTIAGGVLKPLGWLGKPAGAAIGTIAETLDVVGEPLAKGIEDVLAPIGLAQRTDWENNSPYDGSFDWGEIKTDWDESRGFGERIVEPAMGENGTDRGKWTKRIAGFAGDVAADPLSYAAFGSTKVAGKAGRQRYSAKAAERFGKEASVVDGVAVGGADDVIARLNVSAAYLNPKEREILGIEKAGIKFGGFSGGTGVVLPKTAGISNAVGKGLGGARSQIVKRRAWQTISRDPNTIEEASKVLAGASKSMSQSEAASVVGYASKVRQVETTLTNKYGRQFKDMFKGMDDKARREITHQTEAGVATDLGLIQTQILAEAHAAGVKIGDLGGGYMTHLWGDDAWKFIKNENNPLANSLREVLSIDVTKGSASSRARRLKGGKHTISGVEVDFKDGTIAQINAALTKEFPDSGVSKWLEDDSAKLVSAYIKRISGDIGEVEGLKYLLKNKAGVAGALDNVDTDILDSVMKKTADPEQQKALGKIIKDRTSDYKAEQVAARARAVEIQGQLAGWLGERAASYGPVGARIATELGKANRESTTLFSQAKSIVKELSTERRSIEKQISTIGGQMKKIDRQMDTATLRLSSERGTNYADYGALGPQKGNLGESLFDGFKAEQEALAARRAELQDTLRSIEEFTAEMADATTLSRRLSDSADDPDFVTDLAKHFDAAEMAGRKADAEAALLDSRATADSLASEGVDARMQVAEYRAAAKRVKGTSTREIDKAFDEISDVVEQFADDPELAPLVDQMVDYGEKMSEMGAELDSIKATTGLLAAAKEGDLNDIFKMELEKGWERIGGDIMHQEIAVREPIANALRNVRRMTDDGEIMKTVDSLTQFFKSYATATPGFHVRNAFSATFMNATDGVGFKDTKDAIRLWTALHKDAGWVKDSDPSRFLEQLSLNDPETFQAFEAAFGSGAGGAFGAGEMGGDVLGRHLGGDNKIQRAANRASDTKWTRGSGRLGEPVEGVARLAVALNSIKRGDTALDAQSRIARLHFDYSQVSALDKNMKRLIPFWTFASRNLPLQLQQMWMRPGAYLAVSKVAKNFHAGEDGEELPDWLQGRDAFIAGHLPFNVPGMGSKGDAMALSPDLGHLDMAEKVRSFNPAELDKVLANLNPIAIGPLEALNNKNFYFGNELGGTGARVNEAVTSILPPVALAQRLLGGWIPEELRDQIGVGDRYKGKNLEKGLNAFGVPIRNVSG